VSPKRILYVTSMLPASGRHGGRQAVYNHLRDLNEAGERLSVELLVVDTDNSGESIPDDVKVERFQLFGREFKGWNEQGGKILAFRQLLFDPRPRAAAMAFSGAAKRWLQERLNVKRYDALVVEHANAWSVVEGIETVLPLVYIAQNVEEEIIWDELKSKKLFSPHRARLFVDWIKTKRYEKKLLLNASKVICISSFDGKKLAASNPSVNIEIWPELPKLIKPQAREWNEKTLLFVGSPGHFPNIEAARWLAHELIPEVRKLCPDVCLHITGCRRDEVVGQEEIDGVVFEGFVSRERLTELHDISVLFICPVIFGSGVKIKLLEAIAHGLPSVATAESLRGIDFIQDNVEVITRDAQSAARQIADLFMWPGRLERRSKAGYAALAKAVASRKNLGELIGVL
jgi:glycosyltransferase involved in cell wall biosynthesis